MKQSEVFGSSTTKKLTVLINISRWALLLLGFTFVWILNYKYLIDLPELPAPKILIPIVILAFNILLTWLSLEVRNASMAWVLLILELMGAAILMALYGTQFAFLILLIPLMEAYLFIDFAFIIIILVGIGIIYVGLKEIVVEIDKVLIPTFTALDEQKIKEVFKNLTRWLMLKNLLASVTITGLILWLFNEFIKEGKIKEKERKRLNEERQLFQQEIDQLNDKLTQTYRECDALNSKMLHLEQNAENVQDDLKFQNAVTNVINLIAMAKSKEEALDKATKNIEKVVPCQTCCIYLVENINGEEELVPVKISSPFTDMLKDMIFLFGEGIIGWTAATGQSALIRNGSFTPPGERTLLPALLEPEPSALAVPLQIQNKTLGVLYISHPTPNAIDEESEEVLRAITAVLASIISSESEKYPPVDTAKIKETEEKFRQKEQEMSGLVERMQNIIGYNQKIFASLNFKGTVNRVVSTITNTIGCQTCVIFLEKRVEGELLLEAEAVSSPYSDFFKNYAIKPEEEIVGYVYRNQKEVIIGDGIYQSQKEGIAYNVLLKYERSAIVMPLSVKDGPLGVIYISRPEAEAYSMQDQEILSIIAQSSALAINNSQNYEKSIALAITDEITGLENRVFFERRLEEEVARSRRFDFGFAVALIDIDQFGRFNNLYGREVGDHLLGEIGTLLSSYCREADCITRLENDLFGIILLHINKNDAVMTTERLRTFIEARNFGTDLGEAIQLTVSMGVSVYPDDGDNMDILLDQAWVSLEEAQESGGNKTFFMG